jgi:YVTN family beta-propeller protein
MRRATVLFAVGAALLASAAPALADDDDDDAGAALAPAVPALRAARAGRAGPGDAGPLTPAGWRVRPAGHEIGVPKLSIGFQGPQGAALSPDGSHLLALSSGAARQQSADLFDLRGGYRSDGVPYDALQGQSAFYGVAFSPDGTRAWGSGGGQNVIHRYRVDGDRLTEVGQIAGDGLTFPAGLAYGRTPRGARIYVADNLSGPPSGGNPPGHAVSVIDPRTDTVVNTIDLGTPLYPLGVAFDRRGAKAYVTQWAGRSVSVIDTATETKAGDITLSPDPLQADHPSAIVANPRRDEVYTANANSDTVSVIDTRSDRVSATIDVALVRGGPKGAIPAGLAVAPDGRTLYVAEAGENAVAVVDLDARRVRGFIPTAWYPADVEVTPDGRRLVVTNTNDSGAGPNPCGPRSPLLPQCPPKEEPRDAPSRDSIDPQYSGSMIKGSVSVIPVPRTRGALRRLTARVERNNQVRARAQREPRALRQIRHVIYVIKENRTYDQVLGSLPEGNGDGRLTLFDDRSAPNHRALARRFGIYDNFYADAEVSADGHNWSTQANATDYVDKTWPINYSPSPRGRQRAYDFENVPLALQFPTEPLPQDPTVTRPVAAQTVGYLWDNAWAHGVSYRDYGEYTTSGDCTEPRSNTSDTTHLQARFGNPVDTQYPGYNLSCSDHTTREPEWEREFRQFERDGNLPALEIVRLPNDHTRGTSPGAATPEAYVADNDVALGRLVDVLSHSRYWRDTVVLVTEDDAQNGPDHVDAHRTLGYAISAWSRGGVDSTHLDTASMIATAEDLLGLPPMSIVDARASRMWALFGNRPDLRPYDAREPEVVPFGDPGAPVNPRSAPMAAQSARWNFAKEDATPEVALNEAIWKSVRGRHARMPAPRHDRIIGSTPTDEDHD